MAIIYSFAGKLGSGERIMEKGKKPEGGLPFGNTVLIAALVIVLGAIAYFVLSGAAKQPVEPAGDALGGQEARLFLSSLENLAALDSYAVSFEDESRGVRAKVIASKRGAVRAAAVETAINRRTVVFLQNMTIVCEQPLPEGEIACADAANSSIALGYANNIRGQFPDFGAGSALARNRALISGGAISFLPGIRDASYGGVPCKEIAYSIDYTNMSIAQLERAGIDPQDPQVLGFRDYRLSRCVESGTGLPIRLTLEYSYRGVPASFERAYSKEDARGISELVGLATSAELDSLQFEWQFGAVQNSLSAFEECDSRGTGGQRDACYFSFAVSNKVPEVCLEVGEESRRERCYMLIAGQTGEIRLCESAPLLSDECYAESARKAGNVPACEFVSNSTLRDYCLEGARANENSSLAYYRECRVDSDCEVQPGCEWACVQANSTLGLRCNAQPVGTCYAFTGCGCVGGACSWKPNSQYLECVETLETAQTIIDVGGRNASANYTNNTNASAG